MRDLGIFHLRVCFSLFLGAQFSNAAKVPNPSANCSFTVPIDSIYVKEPNQRDFIRFLMAKQMFLGMHDHWENVSIFESNAPMTLYTFKRTRIDFENFHSSSMSFRAMENFETYHFRVVFSADKNKLDDLYSSLSNYTGLGPLNPKMTIKKVENYARTPQTRDRIVLRQVADLEPATLFDQEVESNRSRTRRKIYKITPHTPIHKHDKIPRLVFRTGSFRAGKVKDKVVLELSGFQDCLYILTFENSHDTRLFLGATNATSHGAALDIPRDVKSYLEKYEEPQSSSQSEPRTLSLANWGRRD